MDQILKERVEVVVEDLHQEEQVEQVVAEQVQLLEYQVKQILEEVEVVELQILVQEQEVMVDLELSLQKQIQQAFLAHQESGH
jgi:hypothetical protein